MNSIEILYDIALELEQHPTRWCKYVLARDKDGKECSLGSKQVVSWCLAGHLFKRKIDWMDSDVGRVLLSMTGTHYGGWNDKWYRTVKGVIKLCRKAAKKLENTDE